MAMSTWFSINNICSLFILFSIPFAFLKSMVISLVSLLAAILNEFLYDSREK